jgi:Ni,Fe-hydrogenase III large subunit
MKRVRILPGSGAVPLDELPVLPFGEFRESVLQNVEGGERLVCLTAYRSEESRALRLLAVLASDPTGTLSVLSTEVGAEFQSLTPDCGQAHLFEREIFEQWGSIPVGHPWLKPVRFAPPAPGRAGAPCGVAEFFGVSGEEVHEVAVGPVHAGIIEPGHFRFQCHGENVFHLEISLGYQHRGIERALRGGPDPRTLAYMETLAGDTTVSHASAYCRVIESLTQEPVPARAQAIRGIAGELERLANHIGDLGALAGDIGFLPTMSYCGRIRGDFLNMTAEICGNRFGRGLIRPGGVGWDVTDDGVQDLLRRLDAAARDAESAVELLWEEPSVLARFEGTGALSLETCEQIGLVGVAARACGADRDVRRDFPYGIYRFAQVPVSTWMSGDVMARAFVRWHESLRSVSFVREQLNALPEGPILQTPGPLLPRQLVVKLVEGWRGEICHVAITDAQSRFNLYKVVDPSFHNWFGLALALRNQQISDFPLCNKSFNLSYCGFDL